MKHYSLKQQDRMRCLISLSSVDHTLFEKVDILGAYLSGYYPFFVTSQTFWAHSSSDIYNLTWNFTFLWIFCIIVTPVPAPCVTSQRDTLFIFNDWPLMKWLCDVMSASVDLFMIRSLFICLIFTKVWQLHAFSDSSLFVAMQRCKGEVKTQNIY